jgi:hypothetical protein
MSHLGRVGEFPDVSDVVAGMAAGGGIQRRCVGGAAEAWGLVAASADGSNLLDAKPIP